MPEEKRRIIYLDSDTNWLRQVSIALDGKYGSGTTISCSTIEEFHDALQKETPDMIIMEFYQLRGEETSAVGRIKKLKADPATKDVSIIVVTTKCQDTDVNNGWMSGIDCYCKSSNTYRTPFSK